MSILKTPMATPSASFSIATNLPPAAPSPNDAPTPINAIEAARKTARQLVFAVSAVAVLAIAAGFTGRSSLAIWCLPIVLVVGLAANAKNQDVRRLTNPVRAPRRARQIGEGILLAILALFFVALFFVLWFWHALGQWHG